MNNPTGQMCTTGWTTTGDVLPPGRHLLLRCGHSWGFCGTPRRTWTTSCRSCRSSMCLCHSWGTGWWTSCGRSMRRRLSSRLSTCPRSLDRVPQRSVCRRSWRAEQLVEVPTIVSYSSPQQRTAKQTIDIPVPHGRGDRGGGEVSTRFTPRTGFNSAWRSSAR